MGRELPLLQSGGRAAVRRVVVGAEDGCLVAALVADTIGIDGIAIVLAVAGVHGEWHRLFAAPVGDPEVLSGAVGIHGFPRGVDVHHGHLARLIVDRSGSDGCDAPQAQVLPICSVRSLEHQVQELLERL